MRLMKPNYCALVVVLPAMLLAACGGASPTQSAAPSSPVSASAPVSKSSVPASSAAAASPALSPAGSGSAAAKPAASAGAGASAAAAGTPLKLGLLLPLTGPLSLNGKDNQDTINLYLEQTGGQLAGRKIELVTADDAADGTVGLTKTRQLVESDKVSVLMGLQSTQVCYAIAGYIRDNKIPSMATADCAPQDLTINPKYASPYLIRTVGTIGQLTDPAADWAYKAGYRKAIMMMSDFVAGIQFGDLFASAFVARGGSIVQELYPPLGTNDMGPYLSQLNRDADIFVTFEGGTDGQRLAQQYNNYVGSDRKLQILDLASQMSNGPKRNDLGATAVGMVVNSNYMEVFDSPTNQAFLKVWYAKYPNKPPSQENAWGWIGMQFLDTALKQVNGDVSDTQKFLNALYAAQPETPKGVVKLDQYHDTVANIFIYQFEKSGNSLIEKPIQTYNIGQFWDRTLEQTMKFPFGQMKGKWVGMTKDKLGDVITLPKS